MIDTGIDAAEFGRGMGALVRDAVAQATAPLQRRIAELEARKLPEVVNGRDGRDGKDAEPVDVDAVAESVVKSESLMNLVLNTVAEEIKDGAFSGAIAKHFSANPAPAGKDGKDGRDGVDGKDGQSVSVDDVERMVEGKVAGWALDFERRAQGVLERAIDRIPKPADGKDGRDGVDGIGFDDLTVEQSGERGMVIRFTRGAEVKEFPLSFPVVVDRGVYKDGSAYEQGDAVTWGGSLWIAQKDAPEGKPGMGDGWRLAVKKGRDGKDAK